jgi:hypothetical protein
VQFQYTLRTLASIGYAPLIEQGGQYFSRAWDGAPAGTLFTVNSAMTTNDFNLILPSGKMDGNQHPKFGRGAGVTTCSQTCG